MTAAWRRTAAGRRTGAPGVRMLRQAVAALAWLMPAAAAVAAPAAGAACGVPVRFAWVPADAADPHVGRVDVIEARGGRVVQTIGGVENYYGDAEDGALAAQDLNNDGCPDLVVTSSVAAIGNRSATVYLYDRGRRRFVYHEGLSTIGDPTVDDRDPNCVTTSWKGGAEDSYSGRHCWRGGRLVLVSDYSLSPLYDKETGEFACYEQVETTYVGKRKRVRRKCTKTY